MTATTKTANALQHRQAWLLEQAQRCIDCGGYEMYCDWHAGLTLADQELLDADVECVVLSEAEPNEAEVVAGGLVHTDDEGQEFVVPPFEYEAEPNEAEVVAGGLVHTDDEGQEFVAPPFEYTYFPKA